MKFSLVIPAKNEEKRILLPLLEYYASLYRRFGPNRFEIIVVINNTTDRTENVLRTLRRALRASEIKIHNIGKSEGKGKAVVHGMYHAKGKYIGFTDADGSYSAHEVLRLYRHLVLSQKDAIIPDRYSPKSKLIGNLPLIRRIYSRLFNIVVKSFFMIRHNDTQGGLKIFRSEALKSILPTISTFGWVFDMNLIVSLRNAGFTVAETPITWSQKEDSKLSVWQNGFAIAKELVVFASRQYFCKPLVAVSEAKT